MPDLNSSNISADDTIDLATRSRVASANGGKCWLCGLHGKYATRVITSLDLPLLREFQRRGITHLTDLDSFENLVFLCTACHVAFNDPDLVWIFLPVSLKDIIASEESFQVRRLASAASGQYLPRPVAPGTSPVLYSRYQIRSGYLFTHIFTSAPTQMWSGSPLAAIIRSARMMAGFERLPLEDGGVPINVASRLQLLLLRYGTPEPPLVVQPQASLAMIAVNDTVQPQVNPQLDCGEPNLDLASVGRAFNSALKYVNDRSSRHNFSPDAQAWLTTEIRVVMSRLRKELQILHDRKDTPLLLPDYALNCSLPLRLLTSAIPFLLVQYRSQFQDCLVQLLKACDLSATATFVESSSSLFLISITFSPGVVHNESQTIGNRVFDVEFENEFVNGVQALTLEPI